MTGVYSPFGVGRDFARLVGGVLPEYGMRCAVWKGVNLKEVDDL